MVLEFKALLNSLGTAQNAHHLAAVQGDLGKSALSPHLKTGFHRSFSPFDWVRCEETLGGDDGGAVVFACRWGGV